MKSGRVFIDGAAAVDKLSEIASVHKLKSVMTFGGEPLLFPEITSIIHQRATELDIPKRQIITNGYFSKDIQRIRYVARLIVISGVNDLLLSVDAFHAESIPTEPVKAFATALVQYGVPVRLSPAWLVSRDDNNEYNLKTKELLKEFTCLGIPESDGNIVFPQGNALKYLGEYFNVSEEYKNPYAETPDNITSISIDPDGIVYGGGEVINI